MHCYNHIESKSSIFKHSIHLQKCSKDVLTLVNDVLTGSATASWLYRF